jgi:hypothetical protein
MSNSNPFEGLKEEEVVIGDDKDDDFEMHLEGKLYMLIT